MAQRLRIFVSSPGDVPDERLRTDLVIDKLTQDYSRYFTIESYRWEHEPMLASGGQRSRAVGAEQTALEQRDAALHQRNAALIAQSRYLASEADDVVKDGSARSAIALLRAALPDPERCQSAPPGQRRRSWQPMRALYANRERRRIALPLGATAIAS